MTPNSDQIERCKHPKLTFLGRQEKPQGGFIELWNCEICKSTVCKPNKELSKIEIAKLEGKEIG